MFKHKRASSLFIIFFIPALLIFFGAKAGGAFAGSADTPMETYGNSIHCIHPDNFEKANTVVFPAENCEYSGGFGTFKITDGLPSGAQIDIAPTIENITLVSSIPGGGPGGSTAVSFNMTFRFEMAGTGALSGFSANLPIPGTVNGYYCLTCTLSTVTDYPMGISSVVLQANDTSDFSLFKFTAGGQEGYPSPGTTSLTPLPGNAFVIDSFFDVFHLIDFVGAPGSPLEGLSGTTTGNGRIRALPNASQAIFTDGFESGNISAWSGCLTCTIHIESGGNFGEINHAAAMKGTNWGLQVNLVGDQNPVMLWDTTVSDATDYNASFFFDPNTLSMGNNNRFIIYDAVGNQGRAFAIFLQKRNGRMLIRGLLYNNNGQKIVLPPIRVDNGPQFLNVIWKAGSGQGSGDGYLAIRYGDQFQGSSIGSNHLVNIDRVRIGGFNNPRPQTNGSYFIDEYQSFRTLAP